MKHLGTQEIETERLLLRKFIMSDARSMYENWASDKEVTKYLTWPSHKDLEISTAIIKEWVDSYKECDFYQWAIILKEESDFPIGSIGVTHIDERVSVAQVGYCIGRKWWHKGITTEALSAIIEFLFDSVDIQRIEARHDPENTNSGAVMKKAGMMYEGTLRKSGWNNQGICDACYYSILKSEFLE
ncbi:GNAT family N-acetyltransferase [Clostridium sp. C105KSO13]|uniref:GNAT family N-acetyltransferase n=1 Tax=Clostridium sp. C105KSO13 TaxID=1776045 RepID=UPI0007406B39|nr:GNAT family N-acetyltransferase [Clostridium sp. C105KSO13]CUX26770.1 Putative ribosomal N-acetyltransferase YdaF [Clostridium sp. C105KSO13]